MSIKSQNGGMTDDMVVVREKRKEVQDSRGFNVTNLEEAGGKVRNAQDATQQHTKFGEYKKAQF